MPVLVNRCDLVLRRTVRQRDRIKVHLDLSVGPKLVSPVACLGVWLGERGVSLGQRELATRPGPAAPPNGDGVAVHADHLGLAPFRFLRLALGLIVVVAEVASLELVAPVLILHLVHGLERGHHLLDLLDKVDVGADPLATDLELDHHRLLCSETRVGRQVLALGRQVRHRDPLRAKHRPDCAVLGVPHPGVGGIIVIVVDE